MNWHQKHLLDIESLSAEEITLVLDTAREFKAVGERAIKKVPALQGKTVVNFFVEPSTRTRVSFELSAKRLSADIINFSADASSFQKGESLKDTARNLEALNADVIIIRHMAPGAPHFLARFLDAHVINAGDGTHEHPTQGLLDILTIRQQRGDFHGLTVTLVGDILHSRVARSNIWGLKKLGARVIVCGPSTLIPRDIERLGVEVSYSLDDILDQTDCINLLRIQFERQRGAFFPSIHEYAHLFGMNGDRIRRAKKDVLILAPGPINRGVELTPEVADGQHSVILNQVSNGLLIRMACLYLLAQGTKS